MDILWKLIRPSRMPVTMESLLGDGPLGSGGKEMVVSCNGFCYRELSSCHHCFPGLTLSLITPSPRARGTLFLTPKPEGPSSSPQQASLSNQGPTFTCCIQNDIATVIFSLSSFRKKSIFILLTSFILGVLVSCFLHIGFDFSMN